MSLLSPLPDHCLAESSEQKVAIEVRKLSKRFTDFDHIFSDVSFRINKAESLAIIGPNGTGKSTLLKCCVRLIEPDSGKIWINGEQISGLPQFRLRKYRSKIGFVFQKHQLVPTLSALSNVLHGSLANGSGPRRWFQQLATHEHRARAMYQLDRVGLTDKANTTCSQLSGGQSQRVAIARALMQEPDILIADEPTASLDPRAASEVMTMLRELTLNSGITLLFVSHQLEHARDFGDRIIGLKNRALHLDVPSKSMQLSELHSFFTERSSCATL